MTAEGVSDLCGSLRENKPGTATRRGGFDNLAQQKERAGRQSNRRPARGREPGTIPPIGYGRVASKEINGGPPALPTAGRTTGLSIATPATASTPV